MSAGWLFLIAGLGTYVIRLSAIGLLGRGLSIPSGVERTLRLIAPAVLAAIVANSLFLAEGRANTRVSWYAGTMVAILVVRRFRSVAWAMVLAMLAVWALQRAGVA